VAVQRKMTAIFYRLLQRRNAFKEWEQPNVPSVAVANEPDFSECIEGRCGNNRPNVP